MLSSPSSGTCPSCRIPYDRSQKRKLVDSCGHELCYSCMGKNGSCHFCHQLTESSHLFSQKKSGIETQGISSEDFFPQTNSAVCSTSNNTTFEGTRKKRPRLVDESLESGFYSTSSPDNTLPRRRKDVSKKNFLELQKSNSTGTVESWTVSRSSHASLVSRKLSRLSTGLLQSQILQPKLPKPLYFEVPESPPTFLSGRDWLFHEMKQQLTSHLPTNQGVILSGGPGVGKTSCILALVERSCYGARRKINLNARKSSNPLHLDESLNFLSSHVVAYHFCQADNAPTCLLPEFVHSLAAQLSQAPLLSPYFQLVQSDPSLQACLSLASCTASPSKALVTGILQPLNSLSSSGKIPATISIILVDALCEAEQHRPDFGDTLATFIAQNLPNFPSWLKVICTVRTAMLHVCADMIFHRISLDNADSDERLNKDVSDYINSRFTTLARVESCRKMNKGTMNKLTKFLSCKACGSFLYVKQIMNIIQSGSITIKSSSFKSLPQNLSEIYQLSFNQKFPSEESFDLVGNILCICLASLQPLNLQEVYTIFCALFLETSVNWKRFQEKYSQIDDILVTRRDGSLMCIHPTLRDWLTRRKDGDSNRFMCDVGKGHEAIALSLMRQAKILRPEKVIILVHHILKSGMYKNIDQDTFCNHKDLQAHSISLVVNDISSVIGCMKNVFTPITKVSRMLLLSGANPNQLTNYMDSCPLLGLYSYQGNAEMVTLLLEYGADPNLANNKEVAPLAFASGAGHVNIVELLVQCDARINKVDCEGVSALVLAAQHGHLHVLEYLLAQDWAIHLEHTLEIHEAIQQAVVASALHDKSQVMDILLDLPSADVDKADTLTQMTPACAACISGSKICLEILVKRGANLNKLGTEHAQGPIHCAARQGHWDVMNYLLVHGVNPSQKDGQGRTPLLLAAARGHLGLIELLINHGASMEDTDKEGLTSVSHAIIGDQSEVLEALLDHGADVNAIDVSGRSLLDLAVYQANEEMIGILLDHGADMEKPDSRGIKPVDRVVGLGDATLVLSFLRRGARLGPTTWLMAEGKPEIQIVLLNKLLEDGNTLYRQNKIAEAAHRYIYAIKRLPKQQLEWTDTYCRVEDSLYLNLSRCERRLGNPSKALDLASRVVTSNPACIEARVARAKALKATGKKRDALQEYLAIINMNPEKKELEKAIMKLKDELEKEERPVLPPLTFGSCDSIKFIDEASTACSSNI